MTAVVFKNGKFLSLQNNLGFMKETGPERYEFPEGVVVVYSDGEVYSEDVSAIPNDSGGMDVYQVRDKVCKGTPTYMALIASGIELKRVEDIPCST